MIIALVCIGYHKDIKTMDDLLLAHAKLNAITGYTYLYTRYLVTDGHMYTFHFYDIAEIHVFGQHGSDTSSAEAIICFGPLAETLHDGIEEIMDGGLPESTVCVYHSDNSHGTAHIAGTEPHLGAFTECMYSSNEGEHMFTKTMNMFNRHKQSIKVSSVWIGESRFFSAWHDELQYLDGYIRH